MDKLSKEQRRRCMAAIRSRDTKPELIVRRYLFGKGFRYRLTHKRLPGRPDLVLRKYRTVIFVNGCFWHGHGVEMQQRENGELRIDDSECCKIPKTNREFWMKKICRNMERDMETRKRLAQMGWHCVTVWECQLKPKVRQQTLDALAFTLNHIFLEHHKVRKYEVTEEGDSGCGMAAEDRDV